MRRGKKRIELTQKRRKEERRKTALVLLDDLHRAIIATSVTELQCSGLLSSSGWFAAFGTRLTKMSSSSARDEERHVCRQTKGLHEVWPQDGKHRGSDDVALNGKVQRQRRTSIESDGNLTPSRTTSVFKDKCSERVVPLCWFSSMPSHQNVQWINCWGKCRRA